MATRTRPNAPRFKVLVGCTYPPREKAYNPPGAIVDDVPPHLATKWLAEGVLEPYSGDDDGGEAA